MVPTFRKIYHATITPIFCAMQTDDEFELENIGLVSEIDEALMRIDKDRPIGACYRHRISSLLKRYREHAVDMINLNRSPDEEFKQL